MVTPEGRRRKGSKASSQAPGPEDPDRAPCPISSRGCPSPAPTLAPTVRMCASSPAAAHLRFAQRPTGSRTAGKGKDPLSHPRQPWGPIRSSRHIASGLKERLTSKPPHTLPQPAPAGTPPSEPSDGARARSPAPDVRAQARTPRA